MTDRMTNAEIVALCEVLMDKAKRESRILYNAPIEDMPSHKALTAIRQLQQRWKGIESAPRDGTAVLLWGYSEEAYQDLEDGQPAQRNWWPARHSMNQLIWWMPGTMNCVEEPTAWMPLPHALEPGQ